MNLIGYILPEEQADAVLAAIAQAFDDRSLQHFWTPGKYAILTGELAGLYFIPAGDGILDAPLMGSQTPQDFPEFAILIDSLGGLEARSQIDSATITPPSDL